MAGSFSHSSLPNPISLLWEAVTLCIIRVRTLLPLTLGFLIISMVWGGMLIGKGFFNNGILLLVGVMFLLLFQIFLVSALVYTLIQKKRTVLVSEALYFAWNNLFRLGWMALAILLLCFGAYALFVVPGIVFQLWFSFAFFVCVVEGKWGSEALLKSREYVRHHEWDVFFHTLFLIALWWGVSFLLGKISVVPGIGELLILVIQTCILPLAIAYFFLMYSYLKQNTSTESGNPSAQNIRPFLIISLLGYGIVFIFGSVTLAFLSGWFDKHGFTSFGTSTTPAFEQLEELKGEELPSEAAQALKQVTVPTHIYELATSTDL